MFTTLTTNYKEFTTWSWAQYEPYYQDLLSRHLDSSNVAGWLADWFRLRRTWHESQERLYVAITVDTTDATVQERHKFFYDEVYPAVQAAEQRVKEHLLASGLEPAGFVLPLRNYRTEAALFRQENLPLLSEEYTLSAEYDRIIGAQTVEWDGKEVTVSQLQPVFLDTDRALRERAWRLASQRRLADRQAIDDLWTRFIGVRGQIAANAGLPDYRLYMWRKLLRFDYTPQDCMRFHQAIEEVVVPAALRAYEKRRLRLGVNALRPWDLDVDPFSRAPLQPYHSISELEEKTSLIFHKVDPQLGEYFDIMRRESLLDLDNRKGKAPGGYCTDFEVTRRPFIFANSVGVHDDVQTLLHEGGHAFHFFETVHLPYCWNFQIPMEFLEVASMAMELLSAPYLTQDEGGFYPPRDAARARIEHLERSLLFWPYMAVVDAFQHWAYQNHSLASDPKNCDAQWAELWERFMPGVDWSGLEAVMVTGWQRKQHIHSDPFYYVEYGLAQLGACQIWRNALSDQAKAVAAYRRGLSLGDTVTLPELYAAAGARFAFDAGTLQEAVSLIETVVERLEQV